MQPNFLACEMQATLICQTYVETYGNAVVKFNEKLEASR